MPRPEVFEATSAEELDEVRVLLGEYAEFIASVWPDIDCRVFADESQALRETFPVILLARVEGAWAGCVMLREVEGSPGRCEARRLYVRPAFRRMGVARALVQRLLEVASARGYREMWLVTVKAFAGAVPLYESLGFEHREPFRPTTMPLDMMVFMERDLQ